jgi:hypothetical protein
LGLRLEWAPPENFQEQLLVAPKRQKARRFTPGIEGARQLDGAVETVRIAARA